MQDLLTLKTEVIEVNSIRKLLIYIQMTLLHFYCINKCSLGEHKWYKYYKKNHTLNDMRTECTSSTFFKINTFMHDTQQSYQTPSSQANTVHRRRISNFTRYGRIGFHSIV